MYAWESHVGVFTWRQSYSLPVLRGGKIVPLHRIHEAIVLGIVHPSIFSSFFCIAHHLSCKTWFPKKRERKKETTSVEICTDNISPLFLVLSGLLGESCRVDCISSFNGPPPISLLLLLLLASFPDSLRLPSPRPSPNRMNECKYQISPVPRCHWTWKRRARCASNE